MTMNDLVLLAVILLLAVPAGVGCYLALRKQFAKLHAQDQEQLERTILEVAKEHPDILGVALAVEVEKRLGRSIYPARMFKAIFALIDQGYLYTEMKMGFDLAGEHRRLPYHGLTPDGEQRLLAA